MWKLQIVGIVAVLLVFSRADPTKDDAGEINIQTSSDATEAKQGTSLDLDIVKEKDQQKTAEESSDPSNDDIVDPIVVEDSTMEVANDPYSSRAKTIIICEHGRAILRCPAGSRIVITYANYGRTTGRSVCPRGSTRITNCRARSSLVKVRQACQNRYSCKLQASNSVFGDPCVGTFKYLQVAFRCRRFGPPAECRFGRLGGYRWMNDRDRAKAHRLRGKAKCDNLLPTAWYRFGGLAGRDMPTRPVPTNKCQTHATGWYRGRLPVIRYQRVRGRVCFHWSRNTCRWWRSILVRNCGSYRVYQLTRTPACSLRYCGNRNYVIVPPIITKRVCEGRRETLRCPGNKKINVVSANYGRLTGRSVCPSRWMRTTRCRSAYSNKLLRCACHGQNRCYLNANNAVFGDPCRGTYKYIEIRYRCV